MIACSNLDCHRWAATTTPPPLHVRDCGLFHVDIRADWAPVWQQSLPSSHEGDLPVEKLTAMCSWDHYRHTINFRDLSNYILAPDKADITSPSWQKTFRNLELRLHDRLQKVPKLHNLCSGNRHKELNLCHWSCNISRRQGFFFLCGWSVTLDLAPHGSLLGCSFSSSMNSTEKLKKPRKNLPSKQCKMNDRQYWLVWMSYHHGWVNPDNLPTPGSTQDVESMLA